MRISEDITLFCIADGQQVDRGHWLTLWKKGYPLSCDISCLPQQSVSENIKIIQKQFEQIEPPVFVVAYSYGVISFLAWTSQVSLLTQKSIIGALLVAPPLSDEQQVPVLIKESIKRVYPKFPIILVGSENDPYATMTETESLAHTIGAQFHNAGKVGHLDMLSRIGTWEKGMLLMQTTLLNR